MTRRSLTPQQAMRIKELYGEVDSLGRGRYSQMEIAKLMGVGETTVYRAIRSFGAYARLPEPAAEDEAADSLDAFKKRFPGLVPEPSGIDRLAEEAAVRGQGDAMVAEIRGPLDE